MRLSAGDEYRGANKSRPYVVSAKDGAMAWRDAAVGGTLPFAPAPSTSCLLSDLLSAALPLCLLSLSFAPPYFFSLCLRPGRYTAIRAGALSAAVALPLRLSHRLSPPMPLSPPMSSCLLSFYLYLAVLLLPSPLLCRCSRLPCVCCCPSLRSGRHKMEGGTHENEPAVSIWWFRHDPAGRRIRSVGDSNASPSNLRRTDEPTGPTHSAQRGQLQRTARALGGRERESGRAGESGGLALTFTPPALTFTPPRRSRLEGTDFPSSGARRMVDAEEGLQVDCAAPDRPGMDYNPTRWP